MVSPAWTTCASQSSSRDRAFFHLVGFIDKTSMSATWHDGYLSGDPELFEIAESIISLNEELADEGVQLAVGLGDPVTAALTLMRSFDRITTVSLEFHSEHAAQVSEALLQQVYEAPADPAQPPVAVG